MIFKKIKNWAQKPERVFLTLGVFFGLLSAVILPIFASPDEGYHFYGSYATFSSDSGIPRDILVNPFDVLRTVSSDTYNDYFTDRVNFDNDTVGIAFVKELPPSTNGYIHVPHVASVTDISHLPQALGVLVGKFLYPSVGSMVLMGRLFNLACFVVIIYLAIKKVRYAKWAFVFIALLPMLIHQAGSLSYDAMNIAVIFAFFALMINLYTQKTGISKNQTILLLTLSAALLLTKPSNVILLLFVPFLPKAIYVNTTPVKFISTNLSKRSIVAIGAILSIIVAGLLVLFVQKYISGHSVNPENLLKAILRTYIGNTNPELDPIITTGLVGNFSWNYYRFSDWIVILNLTTLVLVLLKVKLTGITRRFALVSVAGIILYTLAVTVGLYFAWTIQPYVLGENATYVRGLQGRYFAPLLLLLIPIAAYLQKYIKVQARDGVITALIITVSTFSLTYYLIITYRFFYI